MTRADKRKWLLTCPVKHPGERIEGVAIPNREGVATTGRFCTPPKTCQRNRQPSDLSDGHVFGPVIELIWNYKVDAPYTMD